MSLSVSVLWVDLVHFSLVIQHNCQQQKDNNIRTTTSLPQTENKLDSLIVDKFLLHPFISDVGPQICRWSGQHSGHWPSPRNITNPAGRTSYIALYYKVNSWSGYNLVNTFNIDHHLPLRVENFLFHNN